MTSFYNFDREIDVFMRDLESMLSEHEGNWVVYHGATRLGFYPTDEEAFVAGLDRYGLDTPFLLRQVSKEYMEFGPHGQPIHLGGLHDQIVEATRAWLQQNKSH